MLLHARVGWRNITSHLLQHRVERKKWWAALFFVGRFNLQMENRGDDHIDGELWSWNSQTDRLGPKERRIRYTKRMCGVFETRMARICLQSLNIHSVRLFIRSRVRSSTPKIITRSHATAVIPARYRSLRSRASHNANTSSGRSLDVVYGVG